MVTSKSGLPTVRPIASPPGTARWGVMVEQLGSHLD
jgi:hypothetical protein